MFKNVKIVFCVTFGRGCFDQLEDILAQTRRKTASFIVFIVDDVFFGSRLRERIPLGSEDFLF